MEHDNAYKNLFSHPKLVEDLLRGYVEEDWVAELDYRTLEICSGSYVSDDLRDREDDIVWRIRQRGKWLYIYLLIEFQSSIDKWMALRVLVYTGLLYQDLIKQKTITDDQKLPPVFPIVIYNGQTQWSAARNINELIEQVPGGLQMYLPGQRYHLLDEGRVTNHPKDNWLSDIIELETHPELERIKAVIDRLTEQLKGEHNRELRRAFTVWINRMVIKRIVRGNHPPEVNELSEVQTMLAERMTQLTEEWKQEGWQEGRQEGRQEGESKLLERQIIRRFGFNAMSEPFRQKLATASIEELEQWGENFVDAKTLEEVFR